MKENTQILIFEFECLWSDSRKFRSDATEELAVKESYWIWIHSEINSKTQIMIKLVIWMNLYAQSVYTYQIWCFLIRWCSTWLEDSKCYKFVIYGWLKQNIWIYWCGRRISFNLKMNSNWILKLWSISALLGSTHYKLSYGILFVIFGCMFCKLWISKVSAENRFAFLILIEFELEAHTWWHRIRRYRFDRIMD
jgi:hypothetical protein